MSENLLGNVFDLDGLTRFEKTRVIGARALQIALGAPLLIDAKSNELDSILLAKREFEEGVVPITVRRKMPKKLEN